MNIYYELLFLSEIDLLLCQLNEVGEFVTKFIIVESDYTFSGKTKPFCLEDYKDQLKDWACQIIYLKLKVNKYQGAWEMEHASRMAGLENIDMGPDDIIVCGDTDEVPRREVFQEALLDLIINGRGQVLQMDNYLYDFKSRIKEGKWLGTAMDYRKNINTLQELRDNRDKLKINSNAGWHYSYLGDIERIRNKIASYSHKEINKRMTDEDIKNCLKEKKSLLDEIAQIEIYENDYPRFVRQNPDLFKEFL